MIKKGFGGLIKQLMNKPEVKKLLTQVRNSSSSFGTDISGLTRRAQYNEDDKGGFQKTTGQKIAKASKGMLIKGKPRLARKGWK
jgi:hypothetical protein